MCFINEKSNEPNDTANHLSRRTNQKKKITLGRCAPFQFAPNIPYPNIPHMDLHRLTAQTHASCFLYSMYSHHIIYKHKNLSLDKDSRHARTLAFATMICEDSAAAQDHHKTRGACILHYMSLYDFCTSIEYMYYIPS